VIVLGVDPGNNGAFALYDTETRRLIRIDDMPDWYQAVGKKKRKRIDAIALAELFALYDVMGVGLMVMEAVGGRTGQSASAGFVFGYGVGLVYMCALYSNLVIESIPPASWKRIMNVPGKKAADDSAIIARADELFPHDRHWFRGPQGGKKVDRAEAAMLARFGADHVLPTMPNQSRDPEAHVYSRNADTGA
jgi:hypothetical protein